MGQHEPDGKPPDGVQGAGTFEIQIIRDQIFNFVHSSLDFN